MGACREQNIQTIYDKQSIIAMKKKEMPVKKKLWYLEQKWENKISFIYKIQLY